MQHLSQFVNKMVFFMRKIAWWSIPNNWGNDPKESAKLLLPPNCSAYIIVLYALYCEISHLSWSIYRQNDIIIQFIVRPWAPSQYPKRRLIVRSREVSKPRDWYFKLSCRFEIWQVHRQQCCRCASQISERSNNSKYNSRCFETSRDLMLRRLFGFWDGALGQWPRSLIFDKTAVCINSSIIETTNQGNPGVPLINWTERAYFCDYFFKINVQWFSNTLVISEFNTEVILYRECIFIGIKHIHIHA